MKLLGKQDGVTLIEVFAALLIFLLALLPLCRLQYATIQNNSYAYQLTRAINLAEQKMEALLAGTYENLVTQTITPETVGRYTISWNRNLHTPPIAGTATVTVRVTWNDSQNRSHSISLNSIKGE